MNDTLKKAIAGITIAGGLAVGGASLITIPAEVTPDEYTKLLQVYDHEIKAAGGELNITEDTQGDSLIEKINNTIKEREPTESVEIQGETLDAAQYKAERDSLLDKTVPETLLESLTN